MKKELKIYLYDEEHKMDFLNSFSEAVEKASKELEIEFSLENKIILRKFVITFLGIYFKQQKKREEFIKSIKWYHRITDFINGLFRR